MTGEQHHRGQAGDVVVGEVAVVGEGQPDDPTRAAARIVRGVEGILNAAKLAG